jgi:mono/diheme cytochrome c family protein
VPITRALPPPDQRGYPKGLRLTEKELEEGKRHFERTCAACHGQNGRGDGIAAKRGLSNVPSYFDEELRNIGPQELVKVMTEGKGTMPSYARRLSETERWFTAAYVKALQLAGGIPATGLLPEDREKLP